MEGNDADVDDDEIEEDYDDEDDVFDGSKEMSRETDSVQDTGRKSTRLKALKIHGLSSGKSQRLV